MRPVLCVGIALFFILALSSPTRFAYAAAPQQSQANLFSATATSITAAGASWTNTAAALITDQILPLIISASKGLSIGVSHALTQTASAWIAFVSVANADLTSQIPKASPPSPARQAIAAAVANAPPALAVTSTFPTAQLLAAAAASSEASTSSDNTNSDFVKSTELSSTEINQNKSAGINPWQPSGAGIVLGTSTASSDFVTQAELNQTTNALRSLIYQVAASNAPAQIPEYIAAGGNPANPFAAEDAIDQLFGTKLTDITVDGVSGLTAADIPTDIVAANYLPLSGGTVAGMLNVGTLSASSTNYGTLTATDASSTNLSVFNDVYFGGTATSTFDGAGDLTIAGVLTAASTTATSTFNGNVAINGYSAFATTTITGGLTVNGNTNITQGGDLTVGDKVIAPGDIGVGTSTPAGKLAIQSSNPAQTAFLIYGTTTQSSPLLDVFDSNSDNLFRITASGAVGIGTTTPFTTLSVAGSGFFNGSLTAASITATGTLNVSGNTTLANATSSAFAITGISGALLKTLTDGAVTAAQAGVDYATPASVAAAYPFPLTGNATSTLTQFNGGLTAFASSTIGNGTQTGGLTISGGATTTGNAYFTGTVGVGVSTPLHQFQVGASNSGSTYVDINAAVASQAGLNFDSAGTTSWLEYRPSNSTNLRFYDGTADRVTFQNGGNVGIGTTNPGSLLDVNGFINTNGTSGGYKVDGNLILEASSTNNWLDVGNGAGVNTISTNIGGVAIGYDALNAASSSPENTAIGYQALKSSQALGSIATLYGGYNAAVGFDALLANTGGYENTALGAIALEGNTTGIDNLGVGYQTLFDNQTGSNNTAVGDLALIDYTGSGDTAVGEKSLNVNSTGSGDTALGSGTFAVATSSSGDTAVGASAGAALSGATGVAGADETFVGDAAGEYDTLGGGNTLIGTLAGYDITTGSDNISLGYFPTTGVGITTGSNNILIGTDVRPPSRTAPNQLNIGNLIFGTNLGTGSSLSTGNVGIGTTSPMAPLDVYKSASGALGPEVRLDNPAGAAGDQAAVTVADNLGTYRGALVSSIHSGGASDWSILSGPGSATLGGLSTIATFLGSGNVGVGTTSPATTLSVTGNGYLTGGLGVGVENTSAGTLQTSGNANIGGALNGVTFLTPNTSSFYAVSGGTPSVTSGTDNTALGYQALNAVTSTFRNTAIGSQALKLTTGYYNTAVGTYASQSLTSNWNTTAVGYNALANNTAGSNTAVGSGALTANTSGGNNTAVGYLALTANTSTGNGNTAVGDTALTANTTGIENTAIGYQAALAMQTGQNNLALGYAALSSDVSGAWNMAVGGDALKNTTGANNTAVGVNAGQTNTTGLNNTFIGQAADAASSGFTNATAIGYSAIVGASNSLVLGGTGSNAVNVGIGTTTPYARLSVWGPDAASSTLAFNVVSSASSTVFAVFDGGNAQLSGTLTQNSDQRLKTNITSLDASSTLSLIDQLNPVTFNWIDPNQGNGTQVGFIAQQVQQLFPELVSTTSPTALTPNGTLGLNYIGLISPVVSAIQELSADITSIETTLAGFAESFVSQNITASQELCVGSTCVTPQQFQAMVAAYDAADDQSPAAAQPSPAAATDTPESVTQNSASTTPAVPPTVTLNGANPAIINVGASYADLGATVSDTGAGQAGDTNLGYKTFLNGTLVSNIVISTSEVATDTIDYVATDSSGLTATSTRTVIVEAAPSTTQ